MSGTNQPVELLFFGDIVGKSGREAVYQYLRSLPKRPDVVIANVENVTHGFGLSHKHFLELRENGIDLMTGGNHSFDRREFMTYIEQEEGLVRPCNLAGRSVPGSGARVFHVNGVKLGVLNLLGQAFMANYNSPWDYLELEVPRLLRETPLLFLDFHAESTAEKSCMGYVAADMGVSAMVGTHTHVQTSDERILNERMGYITDVGFNGARNSVIGMDPQSSINRMRSPAPTRLEVSDGSLVQVNAIFYTLDAATGKCLGLRRVHEVFDLSPEALQERESAQPALFE